MRAFRRRVAAACTAVALVGSVTACTLTFGEPRPDDQSRDTSTPAVPARPTDDDATAEAPVSAPGRLAVVGVDGSLATMRADGTDRVDVSEGAGPSLQPTWSPDGDRLAWVVQKTGDDGVSGAIVVAGARGEDPVVTPTPFLPYYLSWNPTGDRVAFLGAGGDPETPVEMGVLDLSREPPHARAVAGGDPFFYFVWAPDGRRVLAHTGFDRLEEIDIRGQATSVSERPGLFATPGWSVDGNTVVYTERAGGGSQRLVAVVDDGPPRVLVEGKGALSFVLRPDGRAVAYQLLGEGDGDFYDRRATQPGDGVRVVDVRSGNTRRATSIRAMTFWWSPDGERLLALAPEPESPGTIPFLWQVWEGGRTNEAQGRHSPTIEVLRDYAPFFTQYANSATPWAPDGSAFAYPAQGSDGTGRIVVQEVGGRPVTIGEGVYVTWSP
ncbi:MAG: TolB family protein [Actinomycetota bacterium]